MRPGHRFSNIHAGALVAAALTISLGQSAIPQTRPDVSPSLRAGQEVTFSSPQFVVHALWFKANDETGWAWTGSDEVYAVFSDMDPGHYDHVTAHYGDVDEGDTVSFSPDDQCMAPQSAFWNGSQRCARGSGELNVWYALWEHDHIPLVSGFCPGNFAGDHSRLFECASDDLIGRGQILYSAADLVAMLPTVGSSREFTAVMDQDAGKYRFRYRITRIDDAQRTIVINRPPDVVTPITLQAAVITSGGGSQVNLSWAGATTSTVDIFRNGAKVATTANDGSHSEIVGAGMYQYRVCNLNLTSACSPLVAVTVP